MLRYFLLAAALSPSALPAAVSGEAIYNSRCASCHDPAIFKKMPAVRILHTLETGIMQPMAAALTKDEREAVANYLGSSASGVKPPATAVCRDRAVTVADSSPFVWNGWSPSPTNTRYQPAGAAGLTVDQVRNLKLKWAFGFDGDLTSFSQPAVFENQVFEGSSAGIVYALRAETGCVQWTFQAAGPIRTAIMVVPSGRRHAVLFGDQGAWFYAVEAETGKLLWRRRLDQHPAARVTGSPAFQEGVIFVPLSSWEENFAVQTDYPCCTARGSVVALRVRDGSQLWKSYTVTEVPKQTGKSKEGTPQWGPSGGAVWSAPTIDAKRKVLYITTGNNYSPPATSASDAVIAMDLATGHIAWSRQVTPRDIFNGCGTCFEPGSVERGPDFDFGSSAILVTAAGGRDMLLAGQKSGVVYALDPDRKGDVIWQTRIAKGSSHGGVQWGMASDGQFLYAPIADGELIRVPTRMMDPNDGGGLAALRVGDGTLAWQAAPARVCSGVPGCSPSQLAAATVIPGVVFSGALDGHLRAYSAEDGKVLWDFNTVKEFPTVNGVRANGGALNGGGPVVVKGMVFVNSGYDHFGSITGNVLLAFAP